MRRLEVRFANVDVAEQRGCFGSAQLTLLAALASLTLSCVEGLKITATGDVSAPRFELEREISCAAADLRVSQFVPVRPEVFRRVIAWSTTYVGSEQTRITRLQYGATPNGFQSNLEAAPLVEDRVYNVTLNCGRIRASGLFRIIRRGEALTIENVQAENLGHFELTQD